MHVQCHTCVRKHTAAVAGQLAMHREAVGCLLLLLLLCVRGRAP
jgi:hypothetical protein